MHGCFHLRLLILLSNPPGNNNAQENTRRGRGQESSLFSLQPQHLRICRWSPAAGIPGAARPWRCTPTHADPTAPLSAPLPSPSLLSAQKEKDRALQRRRGHQWERERGGGRRPLQIQASRPSVMNSSNRVGSHVPLTKMTAAPLPSSMWSFRQVCLRAGDSIDRTLSLPFRASTRGPERGRALISEIDTSSFMFGLRGDLGPLLLRARSRSHVDGLGPDSFESEEQSHNTRIWRYFGPVMSITSSSITKSGADSLKSQTIKPGRTVTAFKNILAGCSGETQKRETRRMN